MQTDTAEPGQQERQAKLIIAVIILEFKWELKYKQR
jgi:hypothetical protein